MSFVKTTSPHKAVSRPQAAFRTAMTRHGRGILATRDIARGETVYVIPVSRYRLITYTQLLRKKNTDNPLQVSPKRYLDWGAPGALFNHACTPDLGLTAYPRLALIALRDIKRGEELRWDYSTSIDKDTECEFHCDCGTKDCRGVIGGFHWLPNTVKARYAKRGFVQKFLFNE